MWLGGISLAEGVQATTGARCKDRVLLVEQALIMPQAKSNASMCKAFVVVSTPV